MHEAKRARYADIQIGETAIYRGRVFLCLGPGQTVSSKGRTIEGVRFRAWCLDCGATYPWLVAGGTQNLAAKQGFQISQRCYDCGQRMKAAYPDSRAYRTALSRTPAGYSSRALAAMSDTDRRFVCEEAMRARAHVG